MSNNLYNTNQRIFNINEVVIADYFQNKMAKALYIYVVTGMLTANKGYIPVPEFIEEVSKFCSISARTANRWIYVLRRSGFANIKKGIIYVKGRKKIEPRHRTSKWYIQFHEEHLRSYSEFQNHCIRQIALLLQKHFRYAWKELKKHSADDLNLEHDLALVRSRDKIGCSISKVQEKLGLSKSTISVALKGYTQKQYNYSLPIKGTIARVKYGDILNSAVKKNHEYISNKWGFKYNTENDTYQLSYALASTITAPSYLRKKSK